MRSIFPRLVVVLSLFVFGLSAQAQSSSGALPDSQVTVPNPLANAGGSELQSLPDLIRRVKPSVVSILTYDAKDEPLISGTGFFVRPGEVVTNVHVIKGAQRVEIHTLAQGNSPADTQIVKERPRPGSRVAAEVSRNRSVDEAARLQEAGRRVFRSNGNVAARIGPGPCRYDVRADRKSVV